MAVAITRSGVESAFLSMRAALTAGSLTLLVALGALSVFGAPPEAAPPTLQLGMSSKVLDRMLERYNCSITGFEPDVIPSKAVVTSPSGIAEVVSFDYGWQVFEGAKPGELVAVCLGRRHSTRG